MSQQNTLHFQNLHIKDGERVLEEVVSEHTTFHEAVVSLIQDGYSLGKPFLERVDASKITGDRWTGTPDSTFIVTIIPVIGPRNEEGYLLQLPQNSEVGVYKSSGRRS